ncbi:MAG TPA: response regulator [Hyphomicrobiaceae bacterium]|nr:response regulator [Hyphomicrobiaceae bacterium]
MSDKIRIAVIDAQPMLRAGVTQTFEREPDFEVVGEGDSASDAIRIARDRLPDIMLLDASAPGNSIKAIETIACAYPLVKVVMLTALQDKEKASASLEAGARGSIPKGISAPDLVRKVREISRSARHVSANFTADLLSTAEAQSRARPVGTTALSALAAPGGFLLNMLMFLALVGFIASIAFHTLSAAFWNNPFLNGLIIFVLLIGILYTFRQVLRLYPEIRWVNALGLGDAGLALSHRPVLLAPMATMLRDRTGTLSLSTTSMRSILDSIGSRLDEARDTGKYLVGLLVFLGLLGTFWGLLDTIQSVGRTIGTLDTKVSESALVFEELKSGLAAPLKGMGTAFASSLFGLAGSLVLGFLELQAGHAHNRFYNELEEWLSGITELTPGGIGPSEQMNRQLYGAVYEMQRSLAVLTERLQGQVSNDAVKELAQGVSHLVRQRTDGEAEQQTEATGVLKELTSNIHLRS